MTTASERVLSSMEIVVAEAEKNKMPYKDPEKQKKAKREWARKHRCEELNSDKKITQLAFGLALRRANMNVT